MEKICYGCFSALEGNENVCPYCGYHVSGESVPAHILTPGTLLNKKYTIGRLIGEGGFGITYLAWDNYMQTKIAIKEFYPATLVMRDASSENNTQIYTITKANSNEFHAGLERFVKEASILAKFFNLPGIVSVKDFFYENGTAYIVMEYIDGISLKEYLKQKGGRLSVEETLALMKPVMESLAVVHRQKLLHRDISPDNLMVSRDFQVKLIDFGSARYYDSQSDKSMTVVLKHGYAPVEQYSSNGDQGAWTDVYSLCATMYRMLTGKVPDESVNRLGNDNLISVNSLQKGIPANVGAAIQKGLSVMSKMRQQTVEELYHELYISRQDLKTEKRNRIYQSINRFLIRLIVILALLIAVIVAAWVKRDSITAFTSKITAGFSSDDEAGENDKEPEKEDSAKKQREKAETSEAEKEAESASREKEAKQADETEKNSDPSTQDMAAATSEQAAPEQTEPDNGARAYQQLRSEAQSASLTDDSVIKVKEGRLNNAADYTVGEILDMYSDTEGNWYTFEDSLSGQTYVYYEGQKNGMSFSLEFEVYANDTFKLTGALQEDVVVERYSEFFQNILDYLGL